MWGRSFKLTYQSGLAANPCTSPGQCLTQFALFLATRETHSSSR